MIEKLDLEKRHSFGTVALLEEQNEPSGAKLVESKINELVDAVNGILAAQEQYATIYKEDIVPMLTPENEEPAENVQDRMIGCTTMDIPESYKTDQLTLATLDYSKKLEKENSELKDELDRTRKALDVTVDELEKMTWGCDSSDAEHLLKEIKEITAPEQKD